MRDAHVVLWIFDPTADLTHQLDEFMLFRKDNPEKKVISIVGKEDIATDGGDISEILTAGEIDPGATVKMSMLTGEGLDNLRVLLKEAATDGFNPQEEFIVTNARHYEALLKGADSLRRALAGLADGLSADFIAQDVREATSHLGAITGAVTTDTLLHNIFSHFCIGK